MGARFLQPETGKRMKVRADARPLSPAELVAVRKLMRSAIRSALREVEAYLDAAEVAKRLGLHKRTVLDLAHAGAFDVEGWKAFKPAPNRLRIPVRGVQVYTEERAAFLKIGADAGTEEGKGDE